MLKTSTAPSLNVLISTGSVCQSVRSKKLFYQPDEDASDARTAGPFWCSRTQSKIGPDAKLVALDACRPGRSCCRTA
ncbi:MAG TPA: hypothetical protein VGR72_06525 [Candidatus Acidoferrales bacterium]|nr:hypothetical protein [Candidatus Acidoferrales bacterium]HEV2340505.1 hypothetical protein [Candidatus Acidoferrales bacterium]